MVDKLDAVAMADLHRRGFSVLRNNPNMIGWARFRIKNIHLYALAESPDHVSKRFQREIVKSAQTTIDHRSVDAQLFGEARLRFLTLFIPLRVGVTQLGLYVCDQRQIDLSPIIDFAHE